MSNIDSTDHQHTINERIKTRLKELVFDCASGALSPAGLASEAFKLGLAIGRAEKRMNESEHERRTA